MDKYTLFALAAIVLTAARYGSYFYTIFKGQTKPHAFSWLLWGSVTGVGFFAQWSLGAGPSVWALGFVSSTCFIIAFLAFFIGERDYSKSDWVALIACFSAIPIWRVTDNPLYAIIIVILIDAMTYWPTIRKSYLKPQTEPPISAVLAGTRYFLMLFATPNPSWQTLMYPLFLMASDWGFAVYIVIRRAQLGYPLHEYAKGIPKKPRGAHLSGN